MEANNTLDHRVWVTDYEVLPDCLMLVATPYDTEGALGTCEFVIFKEHNDIVELVCFLSAHAAQKPRYWHAAYNGVDYDAQITEFILKNKRSLVNMDSDTLTATVRRWSDQVISATSGGGFPPIREEKFSVPMHDAMRMYGMDSNARRASLKYLQFTTDWHNVQESEHDLNLPVENQETMLGVLAYCHNDVLSLKQNIYRQKDPLGKEPMADQMKLRKTLTEIYFPDSARSGITLMNAPETKISKTVFGQMLAAEMNISEWDLKNMKTIRDEVRMADLILPYVKFETPEFQEMHEWFRNMVLDRATLMKSEEEQKTKGPKFTINHKGAKTDYGLGGIHGCTTSGVYDAGAGYTIVTADVTSYYPRLAICNRWSPAHLPTEAFCTLYESYFEDRKKYPKSNPLNYLYKIILNATYGLSKNYHAFLYDPFFTFSITVNGQLLLSMLYEQVSIRIPDAKPLMQNTDGLEFLMKMEDVPLFKQICAEWEEQTKMFLEHDEYSKMVIADVNNYFAVSKHKAAKSREQFEETKLEYPEYLFRENGEVLEYAAVKCKGRFEFHGRALYKDKSFLVIPKALHAYFLKGIEPQQYLDSNRNIFDWCGGARVKGDWQLFSEKLIEDAWDANERKYRYFSKMDKILHLQKSGWGNRGATSWLPPGGAPDRAGMSLMEAFRTQVDSESIWDSKKLQKVVRYYMSEGGTILAKREPVSEKYPKGRYAKIESGWKVKIYNIHQEQPWEQYGIDERYYLEAIESEIQNVTKKLVVSSTGTSSQGALAFSF